MDDSGLNQDEIEKAEQMLSDSKATIACWAMGLTQHRNGVAVIQRLQIYSSWVATLERRGAGLCPVRGHSNVQGR